MPPQNPQRTKNLEDSLGLNDLPGLEDIDPGQFLENVDERLNPAP